MKIINLFKRDKEVAIYYPKLNNITGSITASILLRQIIYWYELKGQKPFFKFSKPCKHSLYKIGDSWQEELGFTRSEFEGALKKIGQKLEKKSIKQNNVFVYYWTDGLRRTFYDVNVEYLNVKLKEIYAMKIVSKKGS